MLTLKASYTVKPLEPSPTGHVYLSDFDQSVALTHAPTVYFYRPISGHFLNPIEILKNSLGKALTIFYPLAGRLQRTARGRLEVNCNSMGALFLETESEAKISDFGDFTPTSETRALIPYVDYNKPIDELPLLLVQVTNFSCGGISLGLGISHVLVDGRCATHFVSEWARIARSEEPENLPFLDRTVLKLEEDDLTPPKFDHLEFGKPPMLIGQTNNLEEQKKETTVVMLKLSKEQIQKLKKEANEFPSVYTRSKPFTRYEAVTAHMWRCSSKARLHEIEQLTSVRIGVDFHNRMVPPLPKHYFGNAVLPMRATTTSGELLSKPLGYGCSKIREAIEKVTDEYIRSSLAYMKREKDLSKFRYSHVVGSTQGAFLGNPNIVITSWISLPLRGVDFGWGKEIYMAPGAIAFDGKSFIFPGRDEDGSFDIPFRLQVEHMDAFKKYEAMTAHLWRCASKARRHEIEQLTSVRVPVDFHSRMVPPLPKHYFGNAVFPMRATTTSGELLSKPLGYGCSKIREAIEKEIYMGPGTIAFDGKSFIFPNRDEDGSFDAPFRLLVEHMDAFKKFFSENT
ncbi:hypothetical protein RHSIM_Rhsim01G0025500 [Rhododendron simsii]|uniref:Spermidine hydroxycinnamoyl transferase n=1 Tax=Rhododendron simsii TaxID=118357 RepID=A0A834LUS3_RHOSS|nr:hypothetical protein RHSIM_Rhsim01G0025500 [Rhododendron simsii]